MWKWGWFLLLIGMMSTVSGAQESEFRGFWAEGFNAGFHTAAEVDELLQRVRAANCNAVIVQMRKRGDAHYKSPYEPLASNQDPTFDALAYLIEKAHNGNPRIEVHVWMNCHPVWPGSGWPPDPRHILNRFPEVQTEDVDGNRVTAVGYGVDWGHPIGNDFTFRTFMDVVRRYDIDGIHFDYIRYTGQNWGYNPVSVARFNQRHGRSGTPSPTDELWKQWRRDQVTALVRKVYVNAIALKPHVVVSAALITWGNGPTSDSAWLNSSAYSSVFQDWRAWMEEGILDLAIPMCYYNHNNTNYQTYFQNWINFTKDHQYSRYAVIGLGNYLNTIRNNFVQIDLARAESPGGNRAVGVNFFSYAATHNEGDGILWHDPSFYSELTQKFPTWLPPPEMPWKTNPTKGHIKGTVVRASDLAWVDGATVFIARGGAPVKTMETDGTGFYAGVNLEPGIYSITVSAPGLPTQRAGSVVVSPGLVTTVNFVMGSGDAVPLRSIGATRHYPDGTPVLLYDKVVSGGTDELKGRLYIQDLLRAAGIAVAVSDSPMPWMPGDLVAVKGILSTDVNGERILTNATVQYLGAEAPPGSSSREKVKTL